MSAAHLDVVGLGPAGEQWVHPAADDAVAAATDLVGYGPYLDRVATRGHRRHASDNREELERARHALDLAAEGRRVALISGGDPGIFAMAAAVCEVLEQASELGERLSVTMHPGVSALQAAAARSGAPLGNDFCAISLSDNLKPWSLIAHRVQLAARGDFALAFYNPRSRSRPWQLGEALTLLRAEQPGTVPVVFASAVGRADEAITITTLAEADPEAADMRTLVLVGNSLTRVFQQAGATRVYTPRDYPFPESGAGA